MYIIRGPPPTPSPAIKTYLLLLKKKLTTNQWPQPLVLKNGLHRFISRLVWFNLPPTKKLQNTEKICCLRRMWGLSNSVSALGPAFNVKTTYLFWCCQPRTAGTAVPFSVKFLIYVLQLCTRIGRPGELNPAGRFSNNNRTNRDISSEIYKYNIQKETEWILCSLAIPFRMNKSMTPSVGSWRPDAYYRILTNRFLL